MRNTRLTERRRKAPGHITAKVMADFFRRRRFPRSVNTIHAFEAAQFIEPNPRMIELFAECVGCTADEVRRDYEATRRARARGVGPFAPDGRSASE